MQGVNLTDDELWRAVAENTNALSVLIQEQLELDQGITANDRDRRAELMRSHLRTINKYQREYREYTAELRRRFPSRSTTPRYAHPIPAGQPEAMDPA